MATKYYKLQMWMIYSKQFIQMLKVLATYQQYLSTEIIYNIGRVGYVSQCCLRAKHGKQLLALINKMVSEHLRK